MESQSKLPKVSKDQPYSNRVCALNNQSIKLFQSNVPSSEQFQLMYLIAELDAWDLMQSIRVQKVARMQVGIFRFE